MSNPYMNSDEFLESLTRPQPWHQRWRWKAYRLVRYRPRIRATLRHYWQRTWRGWGYRDVWSLDYYLAGVIAGSITELRDINHGQPCGICDCGDDLMHVKCNGPERWDAILKEMADGFAVYANEINCSAAWTVERDEEIKARLDKSFDLLKKWYPHLWD